MNPFDYTFPVRVHFGAGTLAKSLAAELENYGKNVLLAYGGGSIKRTGLYDALKKQLAAAGKEVFDFRRSSMYFQGFVTASASARARSPQAGGRRLFRSGSSRWQNEARQKGRVRMAERQIGVDMLHGTLWDKILRYALPLAATGICQQLFNATVIAGAAAAYNLEVFAYYVMNAFNQTATTFVGQNYGAGQADRCKRTFALCLMEGYVLTAAACIAILYFSQPLIALFNPDSGISMLSAVIAVFWVHPAKNFARSHERKHF